MVKNCIILIFGVLMVSCGVKTKYLKDKRTKVPLSNKIFKNKSLFNKSLLFQVDTSAIYIREDQYMTSADSFKKIKDFEDYGYPKDDYIYAYKFYANGNINFFVLNANHEIIKPNDLDPNFRGSRGVYYLKNNSIYIDLFVIVGYGFTPSYGIIKREVELKNDSLLVKREVDKETVTFYLKQKLSKEDLKFRADW